MTRRASDNNEMNSYELKYEMMLCEMIARAR